MDEASFGSVVWWLESRLSSIPVTWIAWINPKPTGMRIVIYRPRPKHACFVFNFGLSIRNVRNRPDSFRYAPRFGRSWHPRCTGSFDPTQTFVAYPTAPQ